jgi:hypothetical protein
MIQTLCLLVALVFALLATAAVPQPPRFHFLSFAVAMLVLALLVGHTVDWRPSCPKEPKSRRLSGRYERRRERRD